jgi:hypothetical protein
VVSRLYDGVGDSQPGGLGLARFEWDACKATLAGFEENLPDHVAKITPGRDEALKRMEEAEEAKQVEKALV